MNLILPKILLTTLHSSRMRTARALTVSPSMLCAGGPGPRGVPGPGVPALGGCLVWGVPGPGVPGPGGVGGWYPSMN